jgi:hypothetical protein
MLMTSGSLLIVTSIDSLRRMIPDNQFHHQGDDRHAALDIGLEMSRLIGFIFMAALSVAAMDTQEQAPRVLLIVRERLLPGMDRAYDRNELALATACATLECPHPYLALASVTGPKDIWWFNAFASHEEKDQLEPAYARNKRLMARLRPLARRKEGFRQALTTTLTEYRPDLSGGAGWRSNGARFFVINVTRDRPEAVGAVFESSDGERFLVAPANSRSAADRIAAQAGPGSVILAVQPQWSFPAEAWIAADPDFWKSNPVARHRPSR